MIENNAIAGINTDYGISTILNNFSDDFITDMVEKSISYKFRPYWNRLPNYPEIFKKQFENISLHSTGYDQVIQDQEYNTMKNIIDTICKNYNLQIYQEIPVEELYSLAYYMYQIFVSEFSDRMIYFFEAYIQNHQDSLFNMIPDNQKTIKTSYAKKLYSDQKLMIIYDHMSLVISALAELDIPMDELLTYLSDQKTTTFICNYIQDAGNLYRNYYASYLVNDNTKTDMMAIIRLRYVSKTAENTNMFDPNMNPYIGNNSEEEVNNVV